MALWRKSFLTSPAIRGRHGEGRQSTDRQPGRSRAVRPAFKDSTPSRTSLKMISTAPPRCSDDRQRKPSASILTATNRWPFTQAGTRAGSPATPIGAMMFADPAEQGGNRPGSVAAFAAWCHRPSAQRAARIFAQGHSPATRPERTHQMGFTAFRGSSPAPDRACPGLTRRRSRRRPAGVACSLIRRTGACRQPSSIRGASSSGLRLDAGDLARARWRRPPMPELQPGRPLPVKQAGGVIGIILRAPAPDVGGGGRIPRPAHHGATESVISFRHH